jgi:hypothetical protein
VLFIKQEYNKQKFKYYYCKDNTNYIINYINILDNYRFKYNKELKESKYIITKEFIYLQFPEVNKSLQDARYLAVLDTIKS